MAEGIVVALIFAALGFMGWLHESPRTKRLERQVQVLDWKLQAERERRRPAEQQTEWYRSRFNHPSIRSVK